MKNEIMVVGPNPNTYKVANPEFENRCKAAGAPTEFESLSVGNGKKQLCIIPLDQNTREDAELIAKLWNDYHADKEEDKKEDTETWHQYIYSRSGQVVQGVRMYKDHQDFFNDHPFLTWDHVLKTVPHQLPRKKTWLLDA